MAELWDQINKLEKDFKDFITKSQEYLKEEMKNSNAKVKKEDKGEVVLLLARRIDEKLEGIKEKYEQLDEKLDTIMEMLENNKTKNHRK